MSTLQTLDRGLRALEVVSQHPDGISVPELAAELDVHRAICYRIVSTLEEHLLVSRTGQGRIRLGAGAAVLGARFEPRLTEEARPLLHGLANDLRATAFVSAAEGAECVAIMVAEPEDTVLTVGYRVGSRHPLTRGAAGVAILAARPERPDDPDPVREARRLGYSLTRGELQRGAVGLATAVHTTDHTAGAPAVEYSVGVVAMDGLDTAIAADAVRTAAHDLTHLLTP